MRAPLRAVGLRCAAAGLTLALAAGCSSGSVTTRPDGSASVSGSGSVSASGSGSVGDGATPSGPDLEGTDPGSPTTRDSVAEGEAAAGVRSPTVPEVGDGRLVTVPGRAPAPAPGAKVVDVAVQVEGGLDVDAGAFAGFVLATLNDPRSWAADGRSFARTDDAGSADVIVVLASPKTSADMCLPLVTAGRLSCREGRRAILTHYRWVNGQDDYGSDRSGYRHYVVNHEVGHFLGHGHRSCPGKGEVAPVMMQQTKGLLGCLPNPWPHPEVAATASG